MIGFPPGHLHRVGDRQTRPEGQEAEGAKLPPHLHQETHDHRVRKEGGQERVPAFCPTETRFAKYLPTIH